MRSISLFEKIELEYKGTVFQSAICLFDIDNDGHNELCICNTNGDLHIFKGIISSKPWKVNKGVGPVVVLCGGTMCDADENVLCTLDTEGKCTVYDVPKYEEEVESEISRIPHSDVAISPTSSFTSRPGELRLLHQEMLPPNARCAILEDIDDDGILELIVGFTDRFVRIYKWQVEEIHGIAASNSSSSLSPSKKMFIKSTPGNEKDKKNEILRNSFKRETLNYDDQCKVALSFSLPSKQKDSSAVSLSRSSHDHKDLGWMHKLSQQIGHGSFVMVRQYSLFSQVGSLAVCKLEDGVKQLIVSQPNGGYCIVETFGKNHDFSELLESAIHPDHPVIVTPEPFNPFLTKHSRNYSYTSTEVIGGIKRGNESAGVIGLCTLDGNFMILEDTSIYPKKNWFPSEHRWFSMSKFDVTNDGDDEIVLCSMNGMTYMIDKDRNIVSYNFNENVAAFCAGAYGPVEPNNVSNNCLCYVTLSGKIHIYYNVWISAMKVKCVHGAIIEKLQQSEHLKHILDALKFPNGDIDHKKIQMLVKNTWSERYK